MVAGDRINLNIHCNPGTKLFLGTQAETKLYISKNGSTSHQQITGRVWPDALAVIAPAAVVPFAGSRFTQVQAWHLEPSSELLLVDWVHEGRSALQEQFLFDLYQSDIEIFVNNKKLIVDRIRLEPAVSAPKRNGAFGPYTSLLNLYVVGEKLTSVIRKTVNPTTDYHDAQERWIVMNNINESAYVVRVMSKAKTGIAHFLGEIFAQLASDKFLGVNTAARKHS